MLHFAFNDIPCPDYQNRSNQSISSQKQKQKTAVKRPLTGEYPSAKQVRRVSPLPIRRDIAKREFIQARIASRERVNRVNRHQHDPRDDPYREQDLAHHEHEPHEKVRVHAVGMLDVPKVGAVDREGPSQWVPR